jgi:hypothetical protein
VLDHLSLRKYPNARGSHIYVRPSGDPRFTVLDDLNETTPELLSADGFNPCAVVETSAGNFQAWLKHRGCVSKAHRNFCRADACRSLRCRSEHGGLGPVGAAPGFTNCKPKYRKLDGLLPFVRLKNHSCEQYPMAEVFVQEIRKLYEERPDLRN